MSYAGTYEPCPHDQYARNCRHCLWENGGKERFERELPLRLQHPDDARSIEIETQQVTVYSARCPNPLCSWEWWEVHDRNEIQQRIDKHIFSCEQVAVDWARGPEL